MKKKYAKWLTAIVAAATLLVSPLISFNEASLSIAYAGQSNVTFFDESFYQDGLDISKFYFTESVSVNNENLEFSGNQTQVVNSRVSVKNIKENGVLEFLKGNLEFVLNSMESGAEFGFSLGLKKMYSVPKAAGSMFIYFANVGGSNKCGIVRYDQTGQATQLVEKTFEEQGITIGGDVKLSLDISVDGAMNVVVNNKNLFSATSAEYALEGFTGISKLGTASVTVKTVSIKGKQYDNPENAGEISVDFDNGEFNKNLWLAEGLLGYQSPSGLYVENGVLRFENMSEGVFATMHKYSNFQIDFDIADIQRVAEYDPISGNLKYPVSSWIGLAFGRESNRQGSCLASPIITFNPVNSDCISPASQSTVALTVDKVTAKRSELKDDKNIWSEETVGDRAINVSVKMYDGLLTIKMKYDDQTDYWDVMEYDMGYTPCGYLQFWSMGHATFSTLNGGPIPDENMMEGNFSIDNIVLKNLDENPDIVTVDYKSNVPNVPKDYEYVDKWNPDNLIVGVAEGAQKHEVILGEETTTEEGCSSSMASATLMPTFVVLVAMGISKTVQRRKKDEE